MGGGEVVEKSSLRLMESDEQVRIEIQGEHCTYMIIKSLLPIL